MDLHTDRLLLKPIRHGDAETIERLIFENPDIVKGLAHDGSDPEVRRTHSRNWSGFGPDGNPDRWNECGTGLYLITDRSGRLAPGSQILGVTGFYLEKKNARRGGELFYALDPEFHGQRIMSEACAAVMERFRAISNAGRLYAVYWRLLNPASGKILRQLGFEAEGSQSLLDEYGAETAIGIRRFELWRLEKTPVAQRARVAEEVAIKLGHIESEGISTADENLAAILAVIADDEAARDLQPVVEAALQRGRESPGLAMLRYRPPTVT
ncbi:MAG: GNAT family N-acetyltransferase [Gammaproteobacteria bacterium]|jgi:RimJ/RimL family protein N-acetyltransferase